MLSRIISALFIAVALVGCASVPMGDAKQDAALKSFTAKPDFAGIYIYRNENFGAAIRMDVEVDEQPIGQTAAKTFLYKEVSAGKHTVTSKSENTDTVEIHAVAGKLYYIWQEVKMGFLYARTKLNLVSDEDGKKGVLETQLAETK
jgi:hypothetical protein